MVDEVCMGDDDSIGLDFESHLRRTRPDVLAVTEDDQYFDSKRALCDDVGVEYVVIPKTKPNFEPISTSSIVKWIRAPERSPMRVDLAGGWLDVPRHAIDGGYIVNCAISPMVSIRDWHYEQRSGLGGSGAYAMLNGDDGIKSELNLGVGWQDPAIIKETGLCVWHSGSFPRLKIKRDGSILKGLMALYWTGQRHDTPSLADSRRKYDVIKMAGDKACTGVENESLQSLLDGIALSYLVQKDEGMDELPDFGEAVKKYCGGGFGGYALYVFENQNGRDEFVYRCEDAMAIEPYCNWNDN
jgi:hypothetical protein